MVLIFNAAPKQYANSAWLYISRTCNARRVALCATARNNPWDFIILSNIPKNNKAGHLPALLFVFLLPPKGKCASYLLVCSSLLLSLL